MSSFFRSISTSAEYLCYKQVQENPWDVFEGQDRAGTDVEEKLSG